jgi:hypothetical protein
MNESSRYLNSVEVNHHALLYKCRWHPETAAHVVSQLSLGLYEADCSVLIRTLNALHRIGLPAQTATTEAIRLIFHTDTIVARAAIMTTAAIAAERSSEALTALISASSQPELLKEAMFALIAFGSRGRAGTSVFISALSSADHRIRRLAIRGLEAVADETTLKQVLDLAVDDRSRAVREYAQKVGQRRACKDSSSSAECLHGQGSQNQPLQTRITSHTKLAYEYPSSGCSRLS